MTVSSTNSNPYAILNGTGANSSSSSSSSSSTVDPNSAQGIENQFLTLLTTQLQSQDPSNPMDNSAITSQMAQISQVEGMQTMNTTMQTLLSSQLSSQSMMAATTIGRNALVPGDSLTSTGAAGTALEGGVTLPSTANSLTISVKNSAGQVVDSFSVESPQAGMNYFAWDGTNGNGTTEPAGTYTFAAQASNQGTAVTATPYANQTIEAVSWDASGNPLLQLSNGTSVAMSDVKQIS